MKAILRFSAASMATTCVLIMGSVSAQENNVEDVFPLGVKAERQDENRLSRQFYNPSSTRANPSNERPQPYDFGYNIQDEYGNNQFRQESGDANGAVQGTYGYTDAFGIFRRVKYVADHDGYRLEMKSNEPGTKQESPASAVFQIEDPPQGAYRQVSTGGLSTSVLQSGRRPSVGSSRRFPAGSAAASSS
ncbi:uncharacterized protein LOC111273649 isoform X1 [Varroa jacobsoni]|uniref:Uncharacterized protein n=2 Tax=Varroa destructor TaxID=109461 RepID=A0A7M7JKD2_VARDE|nr:uncharacterized protein LOC111246435 isoform X1 [Varroa destructor]XP_022711158.1 uncharacterized protein LOC111273649 isoform X1 [Varroa jacobsoni]